VPIRNLTLAENRVLWWHVQGRVRQPHRGFIESGNGSTDLAQYTVRAVGKRPTFRPATGEPARVGSNPWENPPKGEE